jgi:hypothetical protein
MKIKEVRNGSLYQTGGKIVRARGKLNSSSVSCSRAHSSDLVAVKASELQLASGNEITTYLNEK